MSLAFLRYRGVCLFSDIDILFRLVASRKFLLRGITREEGILEEKSMPYTCNNGSLSWIL
ncbi:MAG: hypothetical protein C5B51_00295 [Terriglobia bacterium]|nr:MAG: hypothetical protein C5B51_00295 [Terriglobia bacterium]